MPALGKVPHTLPSVPLPQSVKSHGTFSVICQEKTAAAIPHIKAKQGPAVPDKFLIPPDEQDKQYAAMKKKLAGEPVMCLLTLQD